MTKRLHIRKSRRKINLTVAAYRRISKYLVDENVLPEEYDEEEDERELAVLDLPAIQKRKKKVQDEGNRHIKTEHRQSTDD